MLIQKIKSEYCEIALTRAKKILRMSFTEKCRRRDERDEIRKKYAEKERKESERAKEDEEKDKKWKKYEIDGRKVRVMRWTCFGDSDYEVRDEETGEKIDQYVFHKATDKKRIED